MGQPRGSKRIALFDLPVQWKGWKGCDGSCTAHLSNEVAMMPSHWDTVPPEPPDDAFKSSKRGYFCTAPARRRPHVAASESSVDMYCFCFMNFSVLFVYCFFSCFCFINFTCFCFFNFRLNFRFVLSNKVVPQLTCGSFFLKDWYVGPIRAPPSDVAL